MTCFIQAWVPIGHFRCPCRPHGRQPRFTSAIRARGFHGEYPRSTVVGPKTATTGISTSEAICIGPLSLLTRLLHSFNSCASSKIVVWPQRLTAPGKRAVILWANSISARLPTITIFSPLANNSRPSETIPSSVHLLVGHWLPGAIANEPLYFMNFAEGGSSVFKEDSS